MDHEDFIMNIEGSWRDSSQTWSFGITFTPIEIQIEYA